MISIEQIKAARLFLGLEQTQLAERSGVSLPTVQRMENPRFGPNRSTMRLIDAVKRSLEEAGIEFIPAADGKGEGVRLARPRNEG